MSSDKQQQQQQAPQQQMRGDNRNWTDKAADVVDKAKATVSILL
jgi:hypothetical protein